MGNLNSIVSDPMANHFTSKDLLDNYKQAQDLKKRSVVVGPEEAAEIGVVIFFFLSTNAST